MNRADDGLNLLLHEFAHALWLENKIMHQKYTVLNPALVVYNEQAATEEVIKMLLRNFINVLLHSSGKTFWFQNTNNPGCRKKPMNENRIKNVTLAC